MDRAANIFTALRLYYDVENSHNRELRYVMTIQMKVRYFLTDHSGCKRVVAKEMPDRIDLDRKITISSAKLGNNRCTSSGSGKGPWYPCPTMPISGYGSTI